LAEEICILNQTQQQQKQKQQTTACSSNFTATTTTVATSAVLKVFHIWKSKENKREDSQARGELKFHYELVI